MKVATAVARFLEQQGLTHVFGVNGGANLHLIHGVYDDTKIRFIPTQTETGAGYAADAYARIRGLGCAMATSGPGATNLITAIATSYYDSTPTLFITGNVATHRRGAPLGVRQYGFQETPIVEMVRPITKYAVQVTSPSMLIYELRRAVIAARERRMGPVLIDIPDDVQRMETNLLGDGANYTEFAHWRQPARDIDIETVIKWLTEAKRPIFVWGAGMRPYASEARRLAERLDVPVACTWGAVDLLPASHALMCGGFGTHGTRAANMAVQNADLVISLGSRLDTKATGDPATFVREGRVVMVDIDHAELTKHKALGRELDLLIEADVGEFIEATRGHMVAWVNSERAKWRNTIVLWKEKFTPPTTDGYNLMREIAEHTTPEDTIVCDTGTAIGYVCQGFPFNGERLIHPFNMTPMGYSIPGAVGAACAMAATRYSAVLPHRVICIVGDGAAMMSLSELATIRRWDLPVKIILLDNGGHAMCRQTERQWFGGRHASTDVESGLGFPEWQDIFEPFGIPAFTNDVEGIFSSLMYRCVCAASIEEIDPTATLSPQAKYGQPMEDADPQLPWPEFCKEMIVKPLERP